ncbi:MAG: NADP(H)-dependent aldo-keto reductase [Spirulinaceae cyanobacterium SM2_1_0]|nr:NADP(H)-dependent aldo-keto reductase [Spirulinaceae cyanobacterium SM2_1_0]
MRYQQLGDSDLEVSELSLGTMTFGQQNSLADAKAQLDFAVAAGINCIDTAEMYPVPARAETQGKTEEFIGAWLAEQERDRLILATKITGPTPRMPWIRGANRRLDRANLERALHDSLRRLQTDYIDLYQIHWPDRYVPLFGAPDYDPAHERESVPIQAQLEVLAEFVQAGKICYIGLSNETPWGVSEFCRLAAQFNLPKIVSIQNAYSLTNRVFEIHLAETCHHCQVGLLTYSSLAFGLLTGKYLGGNQPVGARLTEFSSFGARYQKPNMTEAVQAYAEVARKYDLRLAQLALAFARSRWFVSSVIVGATSLPQLQENLSAVDIELTDEILADINAVQARYPNPVP